MRRVLTAAALVVTLLVAGCTNGADPDLIERIERKPSSAEPPEAGPAAPGTCSPRKSQRPDGPLPAPGDFPADSYMAEIYKRGRLILGTSQDTLLFSSRNPFTGKIEGFDVDMGRQVAAAIFGDPDKIQIKVIGYDQRVTYAADGTVDLVADTMTITCTRKQQVEFSSVYYDAGQRVLVSTASRAKGLGDLGGRKVCAAAGSTSLEKIATNQSQPVAVSRPTFADCLVAFQQNDVDAISTDDTILAGLAAQDPYAKVIGDKFTVEPYGMAISLDHPEFTRFVNAVLEKNRADGTWKRTYERWLGDFGPAPAPPKAEYTR